MLGRGKKREGGRKKWVLEEIIGERKKLKGEEIMEDDKEEFREGGKGCWRKKREELRRGRKRRKAIEGEKNGCS